MNLIQREQASDAAEIVSDLASTISWKGKAYKGLIGEPRIDMTLETGGFAANGEFEVKVPRVDFNGGMGPFPETNDRIEIDGEVYKVLGDFPKPGSAYIHFVIGR